MPRQWWEKYMTIVRVEEKYCADQFDLFLASFYKTSDRSWEKVARSKEPPDFFLYLLGDKFSVEVTSINQMIDTGTSTLLTREAVVDYLWAFSKHLEKYAVENSILNGRYIISWHEPIQNFHKLEENLRRELINFLLSTQGIQKTPLTDIKIDDTVYCSIMKTGNIKNALIPGGPVFSKQGAHDNFEFNTLVKTAINEKVRKLNNVSEPRILLLLDQYAFSEQEDYFNCLPLLTNINFFHTVFIISPNFCNFVFHSNNPLWLQLNNT